MIKSIGYIVGIMVILAGIGCLYYFGSLPFEKFELADLELGKSPSDRHVEFENYHVVDEQVAYEASGAGFGFAEKKPGGAIYFPIQSVPANRDIQQGEREPYVVIVQTRKFESIKNFEAFVEEKKPLQGKLIADNQLEQALLDDLAPHFPGAGRGHYWVLVEGQRNPYPWLLLCFVGLVIIGYTFYMHRED